MRPCRDNPTEPNWQLQAIVVALSMGPNGPSDYPGHTNKSLVMSTIRGDGFTMQVRAQHCAASLCIGAGKCS